MILLAGLGVVSLWGAITFTKEATHPETREMVMPLAVMMWLAFVALNGMILYGIIDPENFQSVVFGAETTH